MLRVAFLGSLRDFWRKVPGKFRENCWKNFPESRNALVRARRIGANPEKIRFSKISGVRTEENLVNFVFCCFS